MNLAKTFPFCSSGCPAELGLCKMPHLLPWVPTLQTLGEVPPTHDATAWGKPKSVTVISEYQAGSLLYPLCPWAWFLGSIPPSVWMCNADASVSITTNQNKACDTPTGHLRSCRTKDCRGGGTELFTNYLKIHVLYSWLIRSFSSACTR